MDIADPSLQKSSHQFRVAAALSLQLKTLLITETFGVSRPPCINDTNTVAEGRVQMLSGPFTAVSIMH